jgi:DNA-binding winged helix-turn-helix (wHTH) protein
VRIEDLKLNGRYSQNEERLLLIIARHDGDPVSSKDIVAASFRGRERPEFAQKSVVTVLNSLRRKLRKNREKLAIQKSDRRGPHPIEYWVA